MNDEVRQIQEETFRRIVLGIAVIGLIAAVTIFLIDGILSPWFIRAVALIVVAGVAFVVRLFSRLVVASYVLVLQLVGLFAELFLQPEATATFIPYLLIPIIAVSGFLLNPFATLVVAICSIIAVLIILFLIGQLSIGSVTTLLLAPFGLTLLVAFLAAEGKRYTLMLGDRLLEDRTMLKERTLEMMDGAARVENLKDDVAQLKAQVAHTKREVKQTEWLAEQKFSALFNFVQGAIQELDEVVKQLEEPVEALGDLPGSSDYAELLETSWQKLYHLKAMVINLEDVSQIEYGKTELNYKDVDVEQLIAEVAGVTRGLVRGKNIDVRYQVAENLPKLQADPVRLRQALSHILSNSVRYTDRGIIEIQAETNDKPELLIFISDTGIGMHREEIDLVFKKFGRGSGPMARQRQGAGLGLSVSKGLVDLHGGRMWVTSVLGVGSTFYMAFPLEPAAARIDPDKTVLGLSAVRPASPVVTVPRDAPVPVADPTEDDAEGETLVMPHPAGALPSVSAAVAAEADEDATLVMPKSPLAQTTAQATLPGALPGSAAIAAPPPITHPNSDDENGTTIVLPTTSPPSDDDDGTTLVLPKKSSSHQTGVFAHPIRRFGSTYIRRFGLVLAGMLLMVTLVVVVLALINGPVETQMNSTATALALATADAGQPAASYTATPEDTAVQQPTQTPTVNPSATPVPATATSTPTGVPVDEALITAASSATQIPPTPKPTNTPTPAQQLSATATVLPSTPTPTATSPPEPDNTPIIPAAVRQFVSVSDVPHLTFFSPRPDPAPNSSANADPAIKSTDNSRFSWSALGQFLFAGEQNGNRDIFAVDDAGRSVRLTSAIGDDWQPDWSPDGAKVAFSSNRAGNFDIYVMDADGSNLTQLTTSRGFDEWPVWSPDGSKIAFVSDRDGNVEIYTMDVDGSDQQRLTNNPADDWPAAWSPDGSRLVFASERDGDWNLYITLAAGGPIARLTNAPGAERDPIWSPDGRVIAFAYNNGQGWDIYTLPAPSGSISEIPPEQWTQVTNTAADERYPTWSHLFE